MREIAAITTVAIALAAVATGCSEFPCVAEPSTHDLDPFEFSYDAQRVRYTYWLDDGAQRVVFDRDEVPGSARPAVLVHVEEKTSGELHGAVGWTADVRPEETTTAELRPMARARTTAYAAWSGDWSSRWVKARAGSIVSRIKAQRTMNAALGVEKPPADSEPVPEEAQIPVPDLRKRLEEEGISLRGVKLARALRLVGAQQPTPRDFGLSIDVEPVWLFVEEGCEACEKAASWLDANDRGHHVMRVGDPSNTATLRQLTQLAGVEPAVPTAWSRGQLLVGFSPESYKKALHR